MPHRSFRLWALVAAARLILLFIGPLPEATAQPGPPTDRHLQQWQWFYFQRAYPFDRIPAGARQRAREQLAAALRLGLMPQAAISGTQWVSIGPAPIGEPEFPWANASGRVSAIAIHPTDPNIVYIGAAQGGVWKSTDAGASWTPLTDEQCSLAMGALAIDPVNPNIIYAGTGEQHFSGDSYYGCGVLRSIDGGLTWVQLGASVFDLDSANGGARISRILIDPVTAGSAHNTTIYVASDLGLYRSTDSGAHFLRVLGPFSDFYSPVTDLVMDPTNPRILYGGAAFPTSGGWATTGIFKSNDGGTTWVQLTSGLPATGVFRINLAIASSAPQVLYASLALTSGGLGIFKTTDGGATWAQLPLSGSVTPNCQCGYDMVLIVDPSNSDTVYFGGVWLYKSLDGGSTWQHITFGDIYIHVDQHALTFDSLGRLYVGNDGGLYRTGDGGAHGENLNTNLAITQFYPGISLHPTNSSIAFGGTQDNAVLKKSPGSLLWHRVWGGDGGFTAIDFANPNTVYAEAQWTSGGSFIARSDSGGDSFSSFSVKQNGINLTDPAAFIPPLVMDPSDSQTLIFGTNRVYRTTDRAENWSAISPALSFGWFSALAIAPTSSATIYAGTITGDVWVTTNTGAIWTKISAGLPLRYVTDLAIDPSNPAIAYATISGFFTGHVFLTTNGGGTWQDISGNLPDIPVNAIVIDPVTILRTLYIGTDLGVFRSVNGGVSWERFSAGLPNVAVFDLALNPQTGLLVAATHGRSMFAQGVMLPLSLGTNAGAFRTGDSLVISAGVTNPGLAGTVDFYFGALLPDGDTVVFFTDLAFNSGTGNLSSPATLRPIVVGVNLAAPFTFNQPSFFTYRWTGTEPPGNYTLFLAAVRQGALADNRVDPGDIVALSTAAVTFAP